MLEHKNCDSARTKGLRRLCVFDPISNLSGSENWEIVFRSGFPNFPFHCVSFGVINKLSAKMALASPGVQYDVIAKAHCNLVLFSWGSIEI